MAVKQLRTTNAACDSSSQNENVTSLFCACVCFGFLSWLSYTFPVVVPPAGITAGARGQFCTHMSIPGIFQTFHQSTNYHPDSVGGRLFTIPGIFQTPRGTVWVSTQMHPWW